jgi:iron complex outermembrane receptor protein
MLLKHRRAALFATAAANLIISVPAFAQADDAIIVTARRIEERLQDVPISVAVVSQEQIARSNIIGADDLARVVPGLNVDSRYTSETNAFSIRGFSQALRTASSVGTFFADVVAPRGGAGAFPGGDGAGPGSLFDLQNVQVLKGPQGTLFGRNTTGGSVILTPRKPTDNFEGYLEGSYGNYDMFRVQGVVNLPLASWARLRLGVDRLTREGYLHNGGPGPKRFNDVDYTAYRGSLVLDVSPDIENYTIVSYLKSDHVGAVPQMYRANPFTFFGGLAGPEVSRVLASKDPYYVEQSLLNPRSLTKQFQVINTTKWQLSDDLTVKNILSYATFRQGLRQSVFAFNFAIPANFPLPNASTATFPSPSAFNPKGFYGNNQNTFVEEFQVQGRAADGKLDFQGGLYYEHSTPGAQTQNYSIAVGAICQNTAPFVDLASLRCLNSTTAGLFRLPATVSVNSYSIEYINMAAYAQATYALTDQFKLTGGLRYTYDRTRGSSSSPQGVFLADPANPGALYVPAVLQGCQVTHAGAPNCTIGPDRLRSSSKRPTWTLNATYNFTPDMMVYATYARGYRQGSSAPAAVGAVEKFGPETVDNFELGTKTSFRGAVSGHFNLTGFYSKLKDAQLQVGAQCTRTPAQGGCPAGTSATSIFNAGKARIWGLEADGSVRPADFFRIDFAGAYINSKLQSQEIDLSLIAQNFDNILFTTKVGDPLPFTPKYSGNISATVTLPVDESLGKIELTAAFRYTSAFGTSASDTNTKAAAGILATAVLSPTCDATCVATRTAQANLIAATPVDRPNAVKQLDLNFDWRDIGGAPIDFSIFASNVTKQTTYTLIQPLFGSFGFDLRYLGQPRMYGARLRVRFGGND